MVLIIKNHSKRAFLSYVGTDFTFTSALVVCGVFFLRSHRHVFPHLDLLACFLALRWRLEPVACFLELGANYMFSKTNLSVISLMNAQQSFLNINFFLFQSIISILKRHFGKHNYSAIQQVFPILKEFNAIQPDFYVTLQVR